MSCKAWRHRRDFSTQSVLGVGLIWYLSGALTYQWKSRSTACSSDWWFQTFFIFHNIWDNPPHWLYNIFFKMVKTTNQSCITIQCSTPRKPYPAGTTWGKFRARRDVIHGVGAKEVTDDSWSAPPRMLTGSFHCHLWRQEIGKMINGQPRNGRYSVGQLEGYPWDSDKLCTLTYN